MLSPETRAAPRPRRAFERPASKEKKTPRVIIRRRRHKSIVRKIPISRAAAHHDSCGSSVCSSSTRSRLTMCWPNVARETRIVLTVQHARRPGPHCRVDLMQSPTRRAALSTWTTIGTGSVAKKLPGRRAARMTGQRVLGARRRPRRRWRRYFLRSERHRVRGVFER